MNSLSISTVYDLSIRTVYRWRMHTVYRLSIFTVYHLSIRTVYRLWFMNTHCLSLTNAHCASFINTHCLSISRSESRNSVMPTAGVNRFFQPLVPNSHFVTSFFAPPLFACRMDISKSFTNLVLGVFSMSYHSYLRGKHILN